MDLYRAPLAEFVAERKRLAAERKAAGDKDGARELLGRPKPTVSAWAVNQLYWREREAYDALLASAARLRTGDHAAIGAHRDALAHLRRRAAAILEADGHGAGDDVLRRITASLNALAANGGFAPDPPGGLAADREPPGFEALALSPVERPAPVARREEEEREEQETRKREAAAREAALERARDDLHARQAAVESLSRQLAEAQAAADRAAEVLAALQP